jgi:signal transduction histidine kinase
MTASTGTPDARTRRVLRRTAFLLAGAAICVAFLLLQTGLVQVALEAGIPVGPVLPLVVAPVLVLGLLPGVREVEVAGARALLGVRAELVTPARLRAEHRWRSAAWVTLHVLLGGLAGAALVVGLPSLVVAVRGVLAGRPPGWLAVLGVAALPAGVAAVLVAVAGVALVGALVVGAGRLMASWAPRFLGPTWHDRLLVAEDRLAREAEHQRLARDLHDGIGHALSLISLQAAAARRVLAADPARAAASLEVAEQTARTALDDLDGLLATLRDGPASRRPTPGVADLDRLVSAHRDLGLAVTAELDPRLLEAGLPALVSTTVHQVVAEALTNAARYSGDGPVRVRVALAADGSPGGRVEVRVTSRPDTAARARRTGGRGLRGIAERVELLGGTVRAGREGERWLLAVDLPVPERP